VLCLLIVYQLFASADCHVHIFESTVNILENLCWPQCTVHMGPLILANIKQSPTVLENRWPRSQKSYKSKLKYSIIKNPYLYMLMNSFWLVITHVCVLISIIQTKRTLSIVTNTRRRGNHRAVFRAVVWNQKKYSCVTYLHTLKLCLNWKIIRIKLCPVCPIQVVFIAV